MTEKKSVWHPLKNMNVEANIKYNSLGEPIKITYKDGYKIVNQSYIEDILYELGIIKQKSKQW